MEPRILIVDDEVVIASDLEYRLKNLGYNPCGKAPSGGQALKLVEQLQPDLVMMDIVLEGEMDGIRAAEIIRDRWGIPVVFLTAHADSDRLERAKPAYPFGYLLKPFQDRELKITLDMALYVARVDAQRQIAEERLRLFIENMTGMAFIKDNEGKLIFANNRYYEVAGLKRADVEGKTYPEFLPAELAAHLRQEDHWVLSEQKAMESEFMFPSDHGSTYWLTKKFPIPNKNRPPMIGGISIDITHRKLAEAALKESENKFKSLSEQSPFGIFIVQDGLIHYANPRLAEIFGYTVEEMTHQIRLDDLVYPDDLPRVKHQMAKPTTGESPTSRYSVRGIRKDGGVIDIEVHGSMTEQPGRQALVGALQDITERRKVEEELKKNEKLLRKILEILPVGLWLTDKEGTLKYGNPKGVEIWGAEPHVGQEEYGMFKARRLPSGEEIQPDDWALAHTIAEGVTIEDELIEIDAFDGQTRTVLNFTAPVFGDDGDLQGAIVVNHDITQLRKAEEEREKLQAQLLQAQKMEAVGTLAGGIAHDFNNLLQAINGYTQILLLDKKEQDQEYRNLKAIQEAGFRASDLIRQLLLFSRKASGIQRPVKLHQEVEQARKVLERIIPKMVDIQVRANGRPWNILADPVQMEQLLLNLGTNAADAMPDGGTLLIEIENITLDEEYTRINLGAEPGRYVLLTVSDTGHGMDRETKEKMYEPFFTTKEFGKGTGLGLASVYGIVKNHQGYLTCQSRIGIGTTFKIFLPAMEHLEPEETGQEGQISLLGGTETILLVDDEELVRGFAQQALTKFGYTVLTASSGEKALEVYSSHPSRIDLVIMDIGMPGMGGHKCIREIMKMDPKARVIIASGYSIDDRVKKSLQAGAAGFVGKPYRLSDLLVKVREFLNGRKERTTGALKA